MEKEPLRDPKKIRTIEDLHKEIQKVLLLADDGVTKVVAAAIIANRMNLDPVWLMLVASSSGGKCFDGETGVMCYDESVKKAKDILVGDVLMGDDKKPRRVTQTHSGSSEMYTVKQSNGKTYTVNNKHILTLKRLKKRKGYGDIIDIPIEDYLKLSKSFKCSLKGFKVGVNFKEKNVPVDPYYLGLWLGDGHISGPLVSKPDKEVHSYIKKYAKKIGLDISIDDRHRINIKKRVGFSNPTGNNRLNYLWELMKKIGVTKYKHVPDLYKFNSEKIRKEVLAGLLDTDGYLDERQRFQFSSKSKILAEDVLWLARSLGLSAKIYKTKKVIKSYKFKGIYFIVNITGDTHIIPTKITRKKAKKRKYLRNPLNSTISIKRAGKGKYYGFSVTGNGRFLLDDFTVVHNSEYINAISGLPFVYPISDITPNTFMSGQKKADKETSLLLQIQNGIIAFKDFTSILSKNKDARKEIMGQLREIYDGEYTKRTGTGYNPTWRGKIGAIAGSTEIIYHQLNELSAMGDRFIMYSIRQPDRFEVAERALSNAHRMQAYRKHIKDCFTNYLNYVIENIDDDEIELDEETKRELLQVADFATKVRSAVLTDYKTGEVDFVPSPEMPMRVTSQLYTLASAFIAMRRAEPKKPEEQMTPVERERLKNDPTFKKRSLLSQQDKDILYKVAFDSIPRTRRDILKPLAIYTAGATTAGIATTLNLPTPTVKKYLSHINALGICNREKNGGPQGDKWVMRPQYQRIVLRLEKLTAVDDVLQDTEGELDPDTAPWEAVEQELSKQANKNEPHQQKVI